MAKGLTRKQQKFVAAYLASLDGKASAIAAGYSRKSAEALASQLLKNPKVSAEIAKKHGKMLGKYEISAERVLAELAKLAFVDPRKFFRADGSAVPIHEIDDDTAAALAGLEITEEYEGRGEDRKQIGYTKKFKFADKGINLERLGKHLKLFTDRAEITGADGGPIVFAREVLGD